MDLQFQAQVLLTVEQCTRLSCNFDGNIAIGNMNGKITLFNPEKPTKKTNMHLKLHLPIWDLTWTKNRIASCAGNSVILSNPEYPKQHTTIFNHQHTVTAVAAHPVSPLLLSASDFVVLHDLRSKAPASANLTTSPITALEYSDDGRVYVASGDPIRIGSAFSWRNTLVDGAATFAPGCSKTIITQKNYVSLYSWRQEKCCFRRHLQGVSIDRAQIAFDGQNNVQGFLVTNQKNQVLLMDKQGQRIFHSFQNPARLFSSNKRNTFYALTNNELTELVLDEVKL